MRAGWFDEAVRLERLLEDEAAELPRVPWVRIGDVTLVFNRRQLESITAVDGRISAAIDRITWERAFITDGPPSRN
jgi:hypothetical protein